MSCSRTQRSDAGEAQSNPWPLRLESSSLPLSHCSPPILLLQCEGQALPNAREGDHSIQSIKVRVQNLLQVLKLKHLLVLSSTKPGIYTVHEGKEMLAFIQYI